MAHDVALVFAQIGIVQFDCSEDETHTGGATVTRHSVEEGAKMSDHIRANAKVLTLNGKISNHSIRFLSDGKSRVSPLTTDTGSVEDRVETAYAKLEQYKDEGIRLDVITGLRDYENMGITGFNIRRNKETGNILDCSMTLEEVPISTTQQVQLPKANKGKAVKKAATPKQTQNLDEWEKELYSDTFVTESTP